MSMTTLRERRVPWPVPSADGTHLECPLCGISERRFRAGRLGLERHIARPHSRCKACGRVCGAHRMRHHRRAHHRFPTPPIPGLENVA
jgi:hypothetical protein